MSTAIARICLHANMFYTALLYSLNGPPFLSTNFGAVAAAALALATARAAPFGAILSRIWAPNYNLGSAPV